jgi:two-component system, LytTR family, sensor kinase
MKYRIKKAITSIVIQHVMFWICVILLLIYPEISDPKGIDAAQLTEVFFTIFIIGISVYTNLWLFIPRLLKKRKYFLYILSLVFSLLLVSIVDLYFSLEIFKHDFSKDLGDDTPIINQEIILVLSNFILILFFVIITTFVKLLRDWLKMQDNALKIKEMERQHLEAELNSLKAQINPHFLFNTLNNLYSLSLDGSPKTPEMILQLSDLMRYIIYDCRDNKVPMRKEISFTQNYINLEKLRLGNAVMVDLLIFGEPEVEIAPLLFINFLENAFKHGRKSEGSMIKVSFDFREQNEVEFIVENNVYPDSNETLNEYSGIGIENVRKRLGLLYPHNHQLTITSDNEKYCVKLNIQCHE